MRNRACIAGFALVAAGAILSPRATAAQTFPGSGEAGRIRSEPIQTDIRSQDGRQVIGREQSTLELIVHWSVVEIGTGVTTAKLETANVCIRNAHASHAECDLSCDRKGAAQQKTVAGIYHHHADAMRDVQRQTREQSGRLGAAALDWDEGRSNVRHRFERWAKETVRISLPASSSPCSSTSATFATRVYALEISWQYVRRTSRVIRGNSVSLPDQQMGSGAARVAQAERFIDQPAAVETKLQCICHAIDEPPRTPPPTTRGTPTFSGLGLTDEQKTEGGKKWQEGRAAFDEWLRKVKQQQAAAQPARQMGARPAMYVSRGAQTVAYTDAASTLGPVPHTATQNMGLSMSAVYEGGGEAQARGGLWRLGARDVMSAARSLLWTPWTPVRRPRLSLPSIRHGAARHVTPENVVIALTATGASSGNALTLRVLNRSGEPLEVSIPDGLVVQPIGNITAAALARVSDGPAIERVLSAQCLDFPKLPPAAGMVFQVAPDAVQEHYRPARYIFRAARELASTGGIEPDSDPQRYAEFILQWALWTSAEGWSVEPFQRAFVDRTRKSVEARGQRWTSQMEKATLGAAPSRWRDIQRVLAAARVLQEQSQ
jgi:hypothetical protein